MTEPTTAAAPRLAYPWRMAWFVGSLCLVAVGVASMIRAELGVAPYDVLVTGFAATVGTTPGLGSIVLAGMFIAAGTALGGRPGAGTVIAMFLVGPILDVAIDAIGPHREMAVRLPLFATGVLLVATGISGVVAARVGAGPVELAMLALHEVRGWPLAPVRTGMEMSFVAVGWALGGQVGAGTLVFAVLAGPLLRAILSLMRYPGSPGAAADVGSCSA